MSRSAEVSPLSAMNHHHFLFSFPIVLLALGCTTSAPSDEVLSSDSALVSVYAGDFTDGSPEANAILAVANDRALTVATYTKPGWEGGMYIDPVFAQAMIERRGDDDAFSSLVELNALPNARRDAFMKLFEWAKKKSPAYGYTWISPLRKRLALGEPVTFHCDYRTWVPTTDPWGRPSGGQWTYKSGAATFDVRLDGNTLSLGNKHVIGENRGSAWWGPNEWSFQLVNDQASWSGYGMTYAVQLSDYNASFRYVYSTYSASNPGNGERSSCSAGL